MSALRTLTEAELLRQILLAIGSRPDVRLWRKNVGAAMSGGRFIRFGTPGAADLLGLLQGGRFLAIEVKSATGRLTPEQRAWGEMVQRFGGTYLVVRSVEEAVSAVEEALHG